MRIFSGLYYITEKMSLWAIWSVYLQAVSKWVFFFWHAPSADVTDDH